MLLEKEKEWIKILKTKLPDDPIVFDVGAHKAEYSDYLVSVIPKALCMLFEPSDELFKWLQDNKTYSMWKCAVKDADGLFWFWDIPGREISSLYYRKVFNDIPELTKRWVMCRTLDYIHRHVCHTNWVISLLKLDVEGAELPALMGGSSLLKNKAITFIQFENGETLVDAGYGLPDVVRYLNSFGYRVYDIIDGAIVEVGDNNDTLEYTNFVATYKKMI
jgi:FkbM family methyltransferase